MPKDLVRDCRRKQMFSVDDYFVDGGYSSFSGISASCVYMSLCRRADFVTQKCFPSEEVIAKEHGVTPRTVRRAIRTLKSLGLISVVQEKGIGGKWQKNIYLLLDKSMWVKLPKDTSVLRIAGGQIKHKTVGHLTGGHERPTKATHPEKATQGEGITAIAEFPQEIRNFIKGIKTP